MPTTTENTEAAAAEPGEVTGELRILFPGRVEQDVKPRQPCRERPRVRAGVVHAVGEQQRPRIPGRDPGELARDLARLGRGRLRQVRTYRDVAPALSEFFAS